MYFTIFILGFHMDFKGVPASRCGGKQNLGGLSGSFTTINYPKKYDTNIRCEWKITSPINHRIEVKYKLYAQIFANNILQPS